MPHPPAIQLIADKVTSLVQERDEYLAKAAAIDTKLVGVAQQLGMAPEDLSSIAGPPPLPRLAPEDKRGAGTMSAAMLEILYSAEKGYARTELRHAIAAQNERFAEQLRNNINSFYNNVVRYLKSGKIVEVDGLLYHPARAPLPGHVPEKAEALGDNITLFSAKRAVDAE